MKKIKIAFLYPKFFPNSGGASVHGYNLAKGLTKLGYEVHSFNHSLDGYTISHKKNVFILLYWIVKCDLVYIRFGLNSHINYFALIAKLLNKRIIVELNAPSDELLMYDKNVNIKNIDKKLKWLTSYADKLIVVSSNLKQYCLEILKHKSVTVIENGGEIIDINENNISSNFKNEIINMSSKYKKTIIWSGTNTPWQNFNFVSKIVKHEDFLYILITNDKSIFEMFENFKNIKVYSKLNRDEIGFCLKNSDIGLAVYGDYSWSRYGFYNSSLKFYEYLSNGVGVVATPIGHMKEAKNKNICLNEDIEDIIKWINNFNYDNKESIRTWNDVCWETSTAIKECIND